MLIKTVDIEGDEIWLNTDHVDYVWHRRKNKYQKEDEWYVRLSNSNVSVQYSAEEMEWLLPKLKGIMGSTQYGEDNGAQAFE